MKVNFHNKVCSCSSNLNLSFPVSCHKIFVTSLFNLQGFSQFYSFTALKPNINSNIFILFHIIVVNKILSKSTIYDYKDKLNKINYPFNVSYRCSIRVKPRQLQICWQFQPHVSLILTIIINRGCFTLNKSSKKPQNRMIIDIRNV